MGPKYIIVKKINLYEIRELVFAVVVGYCTYFFFWYNEERKKGKKKTKEKDYPGNQVLLESIRRGRLRPAGGLVMVVKASLLCAPCLAR
jgi:hypothetical protein